MTASNNHLNGRKARFTKRFLVFFLGGGHMLFILLRVVLIHHVAPGAHSGRRDSQSESI